MNNVDAYGHVTGRSVYLDDIPLVQGTLYGLVFGSPLAHGQITAIDYSQAEALPGVVKILTHADIPGENQIGSIICDEPLFAEKKVHYQGQPIALVLAESEAIARQARARIQCELHPEEVVIDPRAAQAQGLLIHPPRTFTLGNTAEAWADCAYVFTGRADSNGQEHLYLETQGAYAVPMENGHIRISSSTQGPTAVQRTAAQVLGVGMHRIEVDVLRLGGGFGGKEDQATPWAVMAALGAALLQRPVKLVLHRLDDLRMTGKRHPYSSDYKIGLSADLKIIAYEVTFYQNAGAAADLSPAILERSLFHATNAYYIPHVQATAYSCRTHLPPNTAFRGFGGPQAMFVLEAAIAQAARELGIPAYRIQQRNLLQDGDEYPYGQIAEGVALTQIWSDLETKFKLSEVEERMQRFNRQHADRKQGFALMPITFGISFTNTAMNQARALVHIYGDGSVGISTGAVEMGQGVNTKMIQVAARELGLTPERIKLESTNTTRVANTSPSAASATADLNGKALQRACRTLVARLKDFAARALDLDPTTLELGQERVYHAGAATDWDWQQLVQQALLARVCLSEHAHYATPRIHFDKTTEKGHPFTYHVYGLALTEVTVDCLRGAYTIDAVKIVHDFGKGMNTAIDHGQIEGGLVQGIGWMTLEEVAYDEQGKLLSNSLSTYKIPDIYAVPREVLIEAVATEGTDFAILKSKAVGEPPLMYGIGTYFAIDHAVRAFNPRYRSIYAAPFTHEKVLMALYS
jgi:xanthine dehydrogenase large subunit